MSSPLSLRIVGLEFGQNFVCNKGFGQKMLGLKNSSKVKFVKADHSIQQTQILEKK